MKAIAEYFRDLAADDRYFGAEPPTPDAEMLARIAEREVSRRVEARLDDSGSGVVLKTGSALAAVGLASADTDAEDAAPAETARAADAEAETPDTEAQTFVAEEIADAVEPEAVATDVAPETAPVMPPVAEAPVQPQAFEPTSLMSSDTYEDEDETQDVAPTAYMPPADETPAHLDADSVAAKLQRIRAVVGRGGATAPQDGSDTPASLFAQPERDFEDASDDFAEAQDDAFGDIADVTTDSAEDLTAAIADDTAEAGAQAEETRDDASEDLSDTLEELEDTAEMSSEDDTAEDDDAVLGAATLGFINDSIAKDSDAATADDAAPEMADIDDATAEDDTSFDLSGIMGQTSEDAAEDTTAEAAQPEQDVEEERPAPVRARVIRMRRSAVDAALAAGNLTQEAETDQSDDAPTDNDIAEMQERIAEADERDSYGEPEVADSGSLYDDLGASAEAEVEVEDTAELARLDGTDETAEDDSPESSLSPDAEAELQAELAALVGGIETEDDALVTEDTLNIEAEDDLIDDMASRAQDQADTGLSALDQAEDQVADAVAAAEDSAEDAVAEAAESFEAEMAEDDAADEEPADIAAGPMRPRRVSLPGGIEEDGSSLDRIMSETEAQMSAPDSSRRRESLEQLKAAVAATEADRELSDGSDSGEDSAEETFRDDLRQAVRPTRPIRPQRPTERGERTERPEAAPLKLVASQRVDLPGGEAAAEDAPRQPVMPVRPRRVMQTEEPATAPTDGTAATGGFAAFAEEMGAHELGDLLEAAAAYTSFVEGSEDFSRPQLMSKIKETSDREYSREEGLRSFGTLLRQGRIMKVRNGRFQVSGETRFNPERRAG